MKLSETELTKLNHLSRDDAITRTQELLVRKYARWLAGWLGSEEAKLVEYQGQCIYSYWHIKGRIEVLQKVIEVLENK